MRVRVRRVSGNDKGVAGWFKNRPNVVIPVALRALLGLGTAIVGEIVDGEFKGKPIVFWRVCCQCVDQSGHDRCKIRAEVVDAWIRAEDVNKSDLYMVLYAWADDVWKKSP